MATPPTPERTSGYGNNNLNNSMVNDDDENVLDLADQTQRPVDVAVRQQRIPAWNPILDPVWVIVAYYFLAIILIPTGYRLKQLSNRVVELKQTYDSNITSTNNTNPQCSISKANENKTCILTFNVTELMLPPVLLHYELENFHQNHRSYYESRDDSQLLGRDSPNSVSRKACDPLTVLNDSITLNPCGLIANTFFNDVITLLPTSNDINGTPLVLNEKGIAWSSDLQYMYAQPDRFRYDRCANQSQCSTCCQDDVQTWSCKQPYYDNGTCFGYYYPDDDTTQYLYETYPDIISPIEGVTNEHFVVWMRIATLPTFRKLYGYIDQVIPNGTVLQFQVNANFVVSSFKGSKSLVLSTNNKFGGKNDALGPIFYIMGYFCLAAAVFFTAKHTLAPRRIGDVKYLHYKQE